MTEPFRARITETGIETNRDGALSHEELNLIDRLRASGKVVERHGHSAVGMRVVLVK